MPYGFADAATMSMQKEALRRVREMQRQAQASLEGKDNSFHEPKAAAIPAMDNFSPDESRGRQNILPPISPKNQKNASPQDIFSRLFGKKAADLGPLGETVQNAISSASQPAAELLESFGIDGEKLIIMMIMWAVFNEHKDNRLLLMALGYLLL